MLVGVDVLSGQTDIAMDQKVIVEKLGVTSYEFATAVYQALMNMVCTLQCS